MKPIILGMALSLSGCGAAAQTHPAPDVAPSTPASTPASPQGAAPAPEAPATPPAPPAPPAPAPDNGLNDLAAMTFGCPRAALNAAAREAAKAPSQGSYQFAYFGIVSDSHHAAYEVHFKSNYQAEPVLKYCVAIYCQQGWDPNTTKTSVTLMGADARPGKAAAVATHCDHQTRVAASRAD